MSNVHPSHTDFSRRQEYSPRHNIPLVLGMSQCNHNSSFPPAQMYDPTSASNFLDEFSQPHPQFVDLLETNSSGVRLSYPPLTTPTPSAQFSPQYPITTVLPSVYHHPSLSPSSLSRLVQPALSISNSSPDAGIPRCAVAGSLDPTTGIFYRTPEPPRLRTAQACEKCRKRKAKCSGEHPACQRCLIRGLTCIYAPEGRVRGSQKPRIRPFTMVPPRDSRSARRSKETPTSSNTSSSSSSSSSPSTASTSSSPLVATPSTHTPASSTTATSSPPSGLSPKNSGERVYVPPGSSSLPSSSSLQLYQDSFAEGSSSANFGYNFGSYDTTSPSYLQDVPPQVDGMRPDDSIDIDLLGEYLDWACPKDVKGHCEGEPADGMESLF